MTGYTKLFSSILMSSIWEESNETRLVWVTLLALADQNGHVDGTVKSLARVSRVSLKQCQDAVTCLLGVDDNDRSGVLGGRRIVAEEGGWRLVNHGRYRAKMNADERKERDRVRKRHARAVRVVSADVQECPRIPTTEQNRTDQIRSEADQGAKSAPVQRGGGLILSSKDYARLLQHNAYVGSRLRVPTKLHGDFSAALGGSDPDGRLRGWYANVDAEIEQSGEAILPDVWKWLDRRFRAWASAQAIPPVQARSAEDEAAYQAMRQRVEDEQAARFVRERAGEA